MRGMPKRWATAKMGCVSDVIEAGQLRWLMRLLQQSGTDPGFEAISLWRGIARLGSRSLSSIQKARYFEQFATFFDLFRNILMGARPHCIRAIAINYGNPPPDTFRQ